MTPQELLEQLQDCSEAEQKARVEKLCQEHPDLAVAIFDHPEIARQTVGSGLSSQRLGWIAASTSRELARRLLDAPGLGEEGKLFGVSAAVRAFPDLARTFVDWERWEQADQTERGALSELYIDAVRHPIVAEKVISDPRLGGLEMDDGKTLLAWVLVNSSNKGPEGPRLVMEHPDVWSWLQQDRSLIGAVQAALYNCESFARYLVLNRRVREGLLDVDPEFFHRVVRGSRAVETALLEVRESSWPWAREILEHFFKPARPFSAMNITLFLRTHGKRLAERDPELIQQALQNPNAAVREAALRASQHLPGGFAR